MELLYILMIAVLAIYCLLLERKINRIQQIQNTFLNAQNDCNRAMMNTMQECIDQCKSTAGFFDTFAEMLKQMRGEQDD